MEKALTVEEAKERYFESAGLRNDVYKSIILITGDTMCRVRKTKWSSKEDDESRLKKIEEAELRFDGGF